MATANRIIVGFFGLIINISGIVAFLLLFGSSLILNSSCKKIERNVVEFLGGSVVPASRFLELLE